MAEFNIARIRYTWRDYWTGSTVYVKDDVIRVGGNTYLCMIGHTSDSEDFTTDLTYSPKARWLLHTEGYTWRGDWLATTRYVRNDLFKYGSVIYRVLTEHVSGATSITADIGKLIAYYKTPNWRKEWIPLTTYTVDDVVRYGGYVYQCLTEHTSSTTLGGLETDQAKWKIKWRGDAWEKDWTISTRYKKDDVVRYGGIVYRCLIGHSAAGSYVLGLEEDQAKWEKVVDGVDYKGTWQSSDDSSGTRYKVGDIVKYGPTLWRCKSAHTSGSTFQEDNFDIWMPGLGFEALWDSAVTYQPGDIVQYGGYTYTSMTNNTSSPPSVTGVFYDGESLQGLYDWELLTTGWNMKEEWDIASSYRTGDLVRRRGWLYIAVRDSTGVEPDSLDPEHRSYYNPGETTDPNNVATTWQLVLTSDSYRGEWVETTGTIYALGDIVVHKSTAWRCIQRHESDDSTLVTPDLDATNSYWEKHIAGTDTNVLQYKGDLRTHDGTDTIRLPIATPGATAKTIGTSVSWESFGEVGKTYYVATSGEDTQGSGLSLSAPFKTIKYACQFIFADEANRAPGTIYISTGQYNEILPIQIPKGITLHGDGRRSVQVRPAAGFEEQDMFLVRDATGIRGLTMQGKTGSLGNKDIYGTQRPQGGSFIAFDPGAGPTDETVWIKERSPYVKNISSFGSGTTGLRLDGSLHNGGLKTVLANDMTNFIDDGISVWLSADARAELVSVFTYYCHIGYLCTDGGKIRGTNGNNSYGKFGSVAIGVLATETPITSTVNNQYYGATAPEVYNNANEIFAIGYTHTGQDYVNANYTITGSGLDVAVDNTYTDTRTGGISEIRLLDPGDSSLPGGRGHTSGVRNTAQSGTTISITIAQSDINDASHYAGRAYLTFDTISAADASRPAGAYNIVPATTNGRGYIPQQAFQIVVAEGGGISSITPLDGSHSHRVGDTITVSNVNLGNVGGVPNVTFRVASVSEGQRIYLEQGKGRGQFGIVDEYYPATKLINVVRESDGKRGWDHIVPGWTIATVLDGTTTYRIEPRVEVASPTYSITGLDTGLTAPTFKCTYGHGSTLVAFPSTSENAVYSNLTGSSWSTATTDSSWVTPNCVLKSKSKLKYYIALGNGAKANLSTAGTAWATAAYDITSANYVDICEGPHNTTSHTIIAIADDSATVQKTTADGTTWTGIPTGGAVGFKWIAYGNGKWMIVRANGTCMQSIDNGATWVAGNNVCPSTYDVTGFTWGNNKFVAACMPNGTFSVGGNVDPSTTMISDGTSSTTATFGLSSTFFFSFTDFSTGATSSVWYESETPSTSLTTTAWYVDYQDGVFVAIRDGGNVVTGDGGHVWIAQTSLPSDTYHTNVRGYTTESGPRWGIVSTAAGPIYQNVRFGARAKMRANVETGRIDKFLITEPGSGYVKVTPPVLTVHDTQKTEDASTTVRVNDGCLAQPSFKNRGAAYTKFNQVVITGDGFADQFQTGLHFIVDNLTLLPGPGDNLTFATINDIIYKVGSVETLSGVAPNITAKISLAPTMGNAESPVHGEAMIIRQNYSQVRLTGHDFLDIGTGTTTTSNYPDLYKEGYSSVYPPEQQNETVEFAGGRVFYTSTDQDGNFRVGELFKVEQSTGIVTINASQFDLKGLSELRLGAIIVGGTQAVIREFSKEITFVANSNNIVPTQRAVASYITSRISGGGSNVAANAVLAGTVKLHNLNQIGNTAGLVIDIPVLMKFTGGISGVPLAQAFFANGISSGMLANQELYEDPDGHYDLAPGN